MIDSHAALETAAHEHDDPLVVRVKEFVPPDAVKLADVELKEETAHAAASCVTTCT